MADYHDSQIIARHLSESEYSIGREGNIIDRLHKRTMYSTTLPSSQAIAVHHFGLISEDSPVESLHTAIQEKLIVVIARCSKTNRALLAQAAMYSDWSAFAEHLATEGKERSLKSSSSKRLPVLISLLAMRTSSARLTWIPFTAPSNRKPTSFTSTCPRHPPSSGF